MAASIYPDYPLALTPEQSDYLLSNIKDWSILNGLAVRPSPAFIPRDLDSSGSLAVTAPVTLFPSLFPRSCFEEARAIQIVYNELYASIARDEEWLKEIVEEYEQSLSFLSRSPQFYSSVLPFGNFSIITIPLFTLASTRLTKYHLLILRSQVGRSR